MIDEIQQDLKQAQLDRNEVKVSTLRLLLSELHNEEIKSGASLSNEGVVSVIQREAKKRGEAVEGFRKGGREELAQKEEAELKVLESYLPDQLTDSQLTKLVEEAINKTGAKEISDMGKVIGMVMGQVAGRADGSRVSSLVREKLT